MHAFTIPSLGGDRLTSGAGVVTDLVGLLAMSTVQIEVDDEVLEKLDKVGPVQSRQRSEFISLAIRRALWELEERETAAAYARQPDSEGDAYVDPEAWEP